MTDHNPSTTSPMIQHALSDFAPKEFHDLFLRIDNTVRRQESQIEKLIAMAQQGQPRERHAELWPLVIELEEIGAKILSQYRDIISWLTAYAPDFMHGHFWFLATARLSGRVSVEALKQAVDPLYDKSEKNMQKIFKDHVGYFLGEDAKVVEPPSAYRHRKIEPDAWVTLQGELCVVEIKKTLFTNRARYQLLDYMETFNCQKGVAVAPILQGQLPKNIKFVSFNWDEINFMFFEYYTLETLNHAYAEATQPRRV